MSRVAIPFNQIVIKVNDLWASQGMLLTAGDFEKGDYNTMTVGWGSIGEMWEKPFVQVVVRPTRFTYEFMEKYETFTLCAFPDKYRGALQLLGSISGRDGDKISESGLSPIPSTKVAAPCFAEAELVLECKKMYWDDMQPAHFLDPDIESNYPSKDYHRIYFGEIVAIQGVDSFAL